ncbi:MAG TPA: hypothetical protein VG456_00310 [Candidatus Sulfopaludibacter sp.]|jgi:hypothetical protein|nr:hypothetical protein [Candidatus Sulfopaludibacter sp.]
MVVRFFLLSGLAVCALLLASCANDTSVKTPVPPAPTNHLAVS